MYISPQPLQKITMKCRIIYYVLKFSKSAIFHLFYFLSFTVATCATSTPLWFFSILFLTVSASRVFFITASIIFIIYISIELLFYTEVPFGVCTFWFFMNFCFWVKMQKNFQLAICHLAFKHCRCCQITSRTEYVFSHNILYAANEIEVHCVHWMLITL